MVRAIGVVAMLVSAYFRATGTLLLIGIALLIATIIFSKTSARACALDWAVLAMGVYEIVSLRMTIYSANSAWYAEIVGVGGLVYLTIRLAIGTAWQALVIGGSIGLGGGYLAWTAILQYRSNVAALRDVGLSGIVAFRSRLITPESYVLGEWLTILLLTLPLVCTLALWFWSKENTRWAVAACIPAISVVAASCLSCSRAVFWSMVLFFLLAPALAGIYRLVPVKMAFAGATAALGVLCLVMAGENAAYPGIAQAYLGSHSSQVRSTEGRIAIWKRSVDLWREHPVWGVGAGNSPLYLNSTGDLDETVGFASRTFSLPLQLLTEKGIVGLLLYGVVFSLAAWEMHRRRDLMACCLFAGLVAVVARELTYSSLLEHPVTAMLAATTLGLICRSAG